MPQARYDYYEDVAAGGVNSNPFNNDALQAPDWPTEKGRGAFLTIYGAGETVGDIEFDVKAGQFSILDEAQPNVKGAGVAISTQDDVLIRDQFIPGGKQISFVVRNNDGAAAAEARAIIKWNSERGG